MRSAVVLPHPDGPTRTANSRSGISIDSRSTAVAVLNCFTTSFRITFAMACASYAVGREPAVDRNDHPRHKSRSIREQPDQRADEVLGQAVATHRGVGDHLARARQELPRMAVDVQELQLLGHEETR